MKKHFADNLPTIHMSASEKFDNITKYLSRNTLSLIEDDDFDDISINHRNDNSEDMIVNEPL